MLKYIALVAVSAVLVGCQAKQPDAEPAPKAPEAAAGFPAAKARLNLTYICPAQVTAYSPSEPSKVLGYFKAGSTLKLSDQVTSAGMVVVTYQDPNGPLITAYCYATDVGLGAPVQPAQQQQTQKQEPEKPKLLGGSRPADGNPRYKSLGGFLKQPPKGFRGCQKGVSSPFFWA